MNHCMTCGIPLPDNFEENAQCVVCALSVSSASRLVRKVHVRVNWSWFWGFMSYDWCGYYGLFTWALIVLIIRGGEKC